MQEFNTKHRKVSNFALDKNMSVAITYYWHAFKR